MVPISQPTYGGGTITARPSQAGTISSAGFTILESIELVNELGEYIITQASEKIQVDETAIRGSLSASIAQRPSQGGSITRRK